jgi:dolichyl-phosphate-mannose--protein O-mannosyl transferase
MRKKAYILGSNIIRWLIAIAVIFVVLMLALAWSKRSESLVDLLGGGWIFK